jgi:hypothetical protein
MVRCHNCRQDLVTVCIPDSSLDGTKQANGMWEVPIFDLICIEDGFNEYGGDRLLWGMKDSLDERIAEYVNGASNQDTRLAPGET